MTKARQMVWFAGFASVSARASPAPVADPAVRMTVPPMGWMSWERFRCELDCKEHPTECINEDLYMTMADALVDSGLAESGYTQLSIDDCWAAKERDDVTGEMLPDPERFPSGLEALGKYIHSKGLRFGFYGDAGTKTCAGYPGSWGKAELDVATLKRWGVDYIKMDGCNVPDGKYLEAYSEFGQALRGSNITYSCSWPAYIGSNESEKPFADMYHKAGCNTWRNFADIDNTWESVRGIVRHWAENSQALFVAPGWNDADMLLAGDDHYGHTLTDNQTLVQLAIWSIIGSPMLIAADVRKIGRTALAHLRNTPMIEISQDPLGLKGACLVGCGGGPVVSVGPIIDGGTWLVTLAEHKVLGSAAASALAFPSFVPATPATGKPRFELNLNSPASEAQIWIKPMTPEVAGEIAIAFAIVNLGESKAGWPTLRLTYPGRRPVSFRNTLAFSTDGEPWGYWKVKDEYTEISWVSKTGPSASLFILRMNTTALDVDVPVLV